MIRALIVTAAAGAICLCLAPVAAADLPQIGPAMSGPYFGISPEPPASPLSVDNAVQAAENYLSMMPFSYKGLIQQLVMGDGYTPSQAAYGVAATGL